MIVVRKAGDRGRAEFGWLDSHHTFSFGDYYDPAHMGFRTLRVINDDRVKAGRGFGTHPHRDMEILSYVLEGELGHKDNMGNGSTIRPGDVQRMSAGTGVLHSEQNASSSNDVHFLQVWILPEQQGMKPGYEQKSFDLAKTSGAFRLVASRDGRDGSVTVHQDVSLHAAKFDGDQRTTLSLAKGRGAWVHVARGRVALNGIALGEGDGAAIENEAELTVVADGPSEVLVFDLG